MALKKRILITGSNGFIASHFKNKLKKEGYEVVDYDIKDGDDILDYANLFKKIRQADIVWHFAAIADLYQSASNPLESMEINVKGTYYLAHACYELNKHLNFISTCCAYGNQKVLPSDELSLLNPSELYACTKVAGEYIVLGYHRQFDMSFNILRIPTTYGENMRGALATSKFIIQALNNEPIIIHGDGNQTRTYTYIEDLIEALWLIEKKGIKNEIINISSIEEISVNQMAELIKTSTNSKSEILCGEQRKGQTFKEQISVEKLQRLTGWHQKTSFADGILKCIKKEVRRNDN